MSFNQQVDLVLLSGKIITVDQNDTIADAVAIKDGKIVKVGTSKEVKSLVGDKTNVIDLKGKTVVPGFIDAHAHFGATAAHTKLMFSFHIPPVRYIKVIGSVNSVDDILKTIKDKVLETPKGEWIIGKGRFVQPYPTRQQLDDFAPDHPVMINVSGHTQILNSFALKKAKITRDKPTQEELEKFSPGGKILRDLATGEPTGIISECWDWVFPFHPPWSYKELREAIKQLCDEAVSFGITTMHEFLAWTETTRIYQELHKNSELLIRFHISPCVWSLHKTVDLDCVLRLGLETGFGNEWLKFGSIKIFVDVGGRDEKGNPVQRSRLTQEKLTELVLQAHKAGLRVMMHATTQMGQNMALNAIEAALKEIPKEDHRHRIEHFGGIYWRQEYERLKKLKVLPVPTPYSSYVWYGDTWLERAKPGDKAVFYRTMLNDGLKPPGNSDSVGTEPEAFNPWWSIWCAVARKTKSGKLISPEEGITVMEAIRMYTMNSAYSIFEEKIKGSIEPGKLADLIVLDKDPTSVPTDELQNIKVEMTIIDGKIVYDRK